LSRSERPGSSYVDSGHGPHIQVIGFFREMLA
jgi:hypothetical protein